MKARTTTPIHCFLMFVVSAVGYAGSAEWDFNPTSSDWNTAANWTPMTVPNSPGDVATFARSNTTYVSISANTEVNTITFTSAATNSYTIASLGLTLTLSGAGITNNSAIAQNFLAAFAGGYEGEILFTNTSTAANATISNDAGSTTFFDSSTAGSATIWTGTDFNFVSFWDKSTAGSAFIGVTDGSWLTFHDTSTAGDASIASTGFIGFSEFSNADSATISSGGDTVFYDSSTGGTVQIDLLFISIFGYGGILDISAHNTPGISIGSIEGDDGTFVVLGANNLTVGSSNLNTTFSGVIEDGGLGGSLTKVGSGILALAGTNMYGGNTSVDSGVLQVDGSITSETFINRLGALAGNGTVNGNVTNDHAARVSPGDGLGSPGVLTITGNYEQMPGATLVVQIGGATASEFSVLDVQGKANLNGCLDPVLVNGFVPEIGQSFTILNYASHTGSFSNIQNQVFDHGRKRWLLAHNATSAVLHVVRNGR